MSLRQLGLIAVGVLCALASIPLFVDGEAVTGAMSALFGLVLLLVPVAELLPGGSGTQLENGALVIRVRRARRVLLLVATVLFAAVGVLLVLVAESLFARVAGILGMLVFGVFAVVGLWQMRGPWQFVMTPQALRWDQGGTGPLVAWDAMTRVGMARIWGTATLTIRVEPPFHTVLAGINRRMGGGDVNVPLNLMSVDDELLLSIVTVCAREPQARATIATEATVRRLQA
jgi:hypothetical protein